MKQSFALPWSTPHAARSARGACSFALFLALSSSLAAQGPRLVVSTTDDVPAAVGIPFGITDGDLVAVEAGQPVAPFLAGGHFQAIGGFAPGDVDAYAHLPGSSPGRAAGNVFSLLSNEGGFLDGDLLVFGTGGGVALLVSEIDLANALGAPGANIDVDALAYDGTGRIVFSLADNLASSSLGALSDGDILRLEPNFAAVTLLYSEDSVQTLFTQATGLTDAILDVQALEWASGELWVAVQSPSRHDGSVIAIEGTPRVVVDENAMGLGGAEIDALALMRTGDELPVFHMSAEAAFPGDVVHIETRGAPGATCVVLLSGNSGFVNFARLPGFGGFYVDPFDPWLTVFASTMSFPTVVLDGTGSFASDWALPQASVWGTGPAGEDGWSFQLMDVGTRTVSAPFRIRKL